MLVRAVMSKDSLEALFASGRSRHRRRRGRRAPPLRSRDGSRSSCRRCGASRRRSRPAPRWWRRAGSSYGRARSTGSVSQRRFRVLSDLEDLTMKPGCNSCRRFSRWYLHGAWPQQLMIHALRATEVAKSSGAFARALLSARCFVSDLIQRQLCFTQREGAGPARLHPLPPRSPTGSAASAAAERAATPTQAAAGPRR